MDPTGHVPHIRGTHCILRCNHSGEFALWADTVTVLVCMSNVSSNIVENTYFSMHRSLFSPPFYTMSDQNEPYELKDNVQLKQKKTNSLAFNLQAKYTTWVTTADRRILVPTFVDREV
jgi:hypothetical protein